ncbi:unnamed protein product [Effrenium voratum]|uniref:F5/8 type C domain-containing protein n=1 Tax=Effrenium voratum TaxID=2562239 RepID=A0AA36IQM3_9DINO|nr:unnamed protein product [Effrenium voratum]
MAVRARSRSSWSWWAMAFVAFLALLGAAISLKTLSQSGFFSSLPQQPQIQVRALRPDAGAPEKPRFLPEPATPEPEERELSLNRPVQSDVAGNLAPGQVVTRQEAPKDWLKDRWQAAKGMSGVPLPGHVGCKLPANWEHWLAIDLETSHRLSRVVLDFETAYAKAYVLETAALSGPWQPLVEVQRDFAGLKIQRSEHHVIHELKGPFFAERFVRARFTQLATQWGVSVYRFRIFGS